MRLGHVGPVVFCDANVLYGNLLRDLLMWLGVRRNLRLRWTKQVEAEWTRNLLAHRPDLSPEKIRRTCEVMNQAIPDAMVPSSPNEGDYALPDPDDRHVLAAALACEAEVLLTFNLKDFPSTSIPAKLRVAHPDIYLAEYLDAEPRTVLSALQSMRTNLKRPPLTEAEVLAVLKKSGLHKFVQAVQDTNLHF